MAKFNGFPGQAGGFNMNQLMKEAKRMQTDMLKKQEDIENSEFEVTSGGGAVTIVMNGKKVVKSIKLKKEVVDPDDVEMLEDLIMSALKEGVKKADSLVESEMSDFNIPNGLNGLL